MIRLLIVHPVRLVRELLAATLYEESSIHVVGLVETVDEALVQVDKEECNMVLVDVDLPEQDSLRLARTIHRSHTGVKVLITGLVRSKTAIMHCVENGVAGFLLEEQSLADLVKTIRAVNEDEFALPPEVASTLMARVADLKRTTMEWRSGNVQSRDEFFREITPREWEVLQLVEQGCNNQQIAERLVIEIGTVKNHVHNILRKLDVGNREQATLVVRHLFSEHAADAPMPIDSTLGIHPWPQSRGHSWSELRTIPERSSDHRVRQFNSPEI